MAKFIMKTYHAPILLILIVACACAIAYGQTFQTSQVLSMRIDPISKRKIRHLLGLKETDPVRNSSGALSIGSGPNMGYTLMDEHEVLCPISGDNHGVVCTVILPQSIESENAASIANSRELVSQVIMSGSLAASIRNRFNKDGNTMYYLPCTVTLEDSFMVDGVESMGRGEKVLNKEGLKMNEILVDLTDHIIVISLGLSDDDGLLEEDGKRVMMYACNTLADHNSATSDVYVFPAERKGKVWRFSVDFKVCTINLTQISSFGNRDSTTPLRPDVRLKDVSC